MTTDYVNKEEFYEELKQYYEDKHLKRVNDPKINDKIGKNILLICNNLANRYNFVNYTSNWKDEMIAEGVIHCVKAVRTFNPNKSNNPFGFFTRVAFNAFVSVINKEKEETYVKHKNYRRLGINNEILDESNDISDTIIEEFEEKKRKQKEKQRQKKAEKALNLEFIENDEQQ